MKLFLASTLSGLAIVGWCALALLFMPGGALAMGCAGQLVRASYYGAESGKRTAAGDAFDGSQWLVAHKILPFDTKLRLTYKGRSVVVPVRDRGPYVAGRTLDLSEAVARFLGTIPAGVVTLCMERLS